MTADPQQTTAPRRSGLAKLRGTPVLDPPELREVDEPAAPAPPTSSPAPATLVADPVLAPPVPTVDLVKRRLRELRPQAVRPAQRTGYRPGQVLQLDWAEMPTRPTLAGRERRVYALIASLPYSGAQTAFFSLDMTIESFLEGHVRAFEWLGGVPRECVYDNLRAVVG